MITQNDIIQQRNLRKAVRQIADFCFGNQNDPKWGSAWIAVAQCLDASDGLVLTDLEPFPKAKYTTGLFVVQRADGKYLAIDSNSGGYPWWVDHVGRAERFEADERAISYIRGLGPTERGDGPLNIFELGLSPALSVDAFEGLASASIRAKALAKLNPVERKALGLE